MSIKRKKMISAICWPLGYHLETHRLQKDAILQCSSAQFSTIWVFGIGHQMMHLATFHHSTKHSSGKLENHQLSSLPGRSPRLPWRILVVTMSRNVPTCLGCRVDFICCIVIGIAPQQSGQMAGFRWCVLNIIHVCPACIYANVDYGDDVVVVIYWWLVVYIIDGGCERIFWLSSSERYWMDLNGLFPNTSTTSLSWLIETRWNCPCLASLGAHRRQLCGISSTFLSIIWWGTDQNSTGKIGFDWEKWEISMGKLISLHFMGNSVGFSMDFPQNLSHQTRQLCFVTEIRCKFPFSGFSTIARRAESYGVIWSHWVSPNI